MNYLAHIYLSADAAGEPDKNTLLGNYMADAVKGQAILSFPEGVRQGILLHRSIDEFTDNHPVVAQSKLRLRPVYRKYAGVIADVFYDHFLAANWEEYSPVSLPEFSKNVYTLLQESEEMMPLKSRMFLQYLMRHDMLCKYAKTEGIDQALTGLASRTTFKSGMEQAVGELEKNYLQYEEEFRLFFPDLRAMVKEAKASFQ